MLVVILARKSLEQTLCSNLQQYQAGAINIQALRIKTGEETNGSKPEYQPNKKNNVYEKSMGGGDWENTHGRWPANILFMHKTECKQEGVLSVRCSRYTKGKGRGSDQIYRPYDRDPNAIRKGYGNDAGVEDIRTWVCVSGCSGTCISQKFARFFKQIKEG